MRMPIGSVNDELQLNDPQTLYRRWEDSQWSPFAIDLTADRAQWPKLGDEQRELLLFALSSLMVAEERITTKFSGLVGAHGTEEEATFLATQQVDEARHMQFYARIQDEVIAAPQVIGAHVQRAREHVSDSFRQLLDVALVNAHARLVAAPADLAAKVSFVTLYHLVLESTLGLTTFKFITDYLSANQLLPGSSTATRRSTTTRPDISATACGTSAKRSASTRSGDTLRQTLRDLLPSVAESLKPPGPGATESVLDISEDDLRLFALDGLTRRLSIIGVPINTL